MKKLFWVLVVGSIVFLGGCASSKYRFEYQDQQADIVWPQAPNVSRYRYLGVIQGDRNFKKIEGSEGIARRGVSWFGQFLFGDETPRLMHRPQSGAVDEQGQRLFITDVGSKSLFVFNLGGDSEKGSDNSSENGSENGSDSRSELGLSDSKLDVWDGIDSETSFITPIAVCVLDENQIFVSDAELGYVIKFDAKGESLARIGEKELVRPTGLACDKEKKTIYVADSQSHKIHKFSSDGKSLLTFGQKGSAKGEFNSPTHLTFANDKLYVSDTLNARVQVLDPQGNWLSDFGKRGMYVGNLPRPKGVAVDSDQHIYVVESYYDHLIVFDEVGQVLLPIGGSGNKPGQFNLPAGVWIDKNDVVYVADMFNSRIMVFQYLKQRSQTNAAKH